MHQDSDEAIEKRANSVVAELGDLMRDLVKLRDAHGLTQSEMAERMGVSQPSVAAFERYDANPTVGSITRYAIAVGARLDLTVVDDYEDANWATVTDLRSRMVRPTAPEPAFDDEASLPWSGDLAVHV